MNEAEDASTPADSSSPDSGAPAVFSAGSSAPTQNPVGTQ